MRLKIFLLNVLRSFFLRIFPDLRDLLNQKDVVNSLKSVKQNSIINEKVKIYGLHRIIESSIDSYTYISFNCRINNTTIGKFCSIGPNFISGWGIHPLNGISTSPMFYSTANQNGFSLSTTDKIIERKEIKIGNDVFVGMNVILLDGVSIGDGAVLAAGTVITKDVPPFAVVAGVPGKVIKYRFDKNTIDKLLQIKWWNFHDEELKDVEKYFFNIEEFLKIKSESN